MNLPPGIDIELPPLAKARIWKDTLDFISQFIDDIILYVCYYAIAILCGFKFIIYIVNGFTTKPHMGPSTLDDSSFIR
jgi:hypothetical protein